MSKLKKGDIASEAERLTEGTDWIPGVFKTEHGTEPPEGAQEAAGEADAPEDAADEAEAHALAA